MYRYSGQSRFNSVMKSNRYRPFLLIAIVAAIIIAVFLLGNKVGFDTTTFGTQRDAKLRSEIQHAVSQNNQLSRLGGSSTSATLGRIRAYIHGVETINDLNVGMFGESGRLFLQADFDAIYAIIDEYDAKLQSGQKTNDSLTALTEAITAMSDKTYTLIGQ